MSAKKANSNKRADTDYDNTARRGKATRDEADPAETRHRPPTGTDANEVRKEQGKRKKTGKPKEMPTQKKSMPPEAKETGRNAYRTLGKKPKRTGRRNREDDNRTEKNRLGASSAKIRRIIRHQQGPHRLHQNKRSAGAGNLQNITH